MTMSFDRSHKDKQYFIDGSTFNCPFCNRGNVSYSITNTGSFDSSNTKTTYFYVIRCKDCNKDSFHLSAYNLSTSSSGHSSRIFEFPPKQIIISTQSGKLSSTIEDIFDKERNHLKELDDVFFYNQPTSYFTIDERIPSSIRKPLNECDGCLKNNFLTGSSADLRKAIYKLLKHENIPETDTQNEFISHDKRVDQLKNKYPKIESKLFDELKAVHMLTSQELHENDWEDFDGHTLRFLIGVTNEILTEMYVTPDETDKKRKKLAELKSKANPKKK